MANLSDMRKTLGLLVALALLGSLAPGPVAARGPRPWRFAPHGITTNYFKAVTEPEVVEVAAHDGTLLYTRVYRPKTSKAPGFKTPVILVHSPYFNDFTDQANTRSQDIVKFFTPKGYTVVLSDIRGTGNSGGCNEQDGLNQAKDFKTLVEHFAKQRWTNGKVGSYGKSYDGESQNAGAVLKPKGLETMVTVAAISGLYDVAYFHGVPYVGTGALSAGVYAGNNPYPEDRPERTPGRGTCQHDNIANGADPRGDMTPYWAEREFRYGVKDVRASVLYVTGLVDGTVTPINIDGWYDQLPTFKRAIFGYWPHQYPYDADPSYARDDWYDMVHAWFDHELLGLKTKIEKWPAVQVQDENNVWRAAPSFRGMGRPRTFALAAEKLGGKPEEASTVSFTEDGQAMWDSAKFKAKTHLSGQAILKVTISLDRPDAHFAIALQEVRSDGSIEDVTTGYLSAPHRKSLQSPELAPIGEALRYKIRTFPFDDWVDKGSSLRLVISGSDSSVLPAGTEYTATVATDGASKLFVPVVRKVCGLKVDQTNKPRSTVPGCRRALRRAYS